MPIAVWYFNKAWVYIKTLMPFPAKFQGCFEELAESEQISHIEECHSKNLEPRVNKLFIWELTVWFFHLCYIDAIKVLWRFCHWILYVENDRHAACVPNVRTCATGRSPKQTGESVPLVQLWMMRSGADSRAQSFHQVGPAGAFAVTHLRRSRVQLPTHKSNTSETVLTWMLSCLGWKCSIWNSSPLSRAAYFPFSQHPRGGGGEGMSESHCGRTPMASKPAHIDKHALHQQIIVHRWFGSSLLWDEEQKSGWPWVVVGARYWDVSTLRWSPCFYG